MKKILNNTYFFIHKCYAYVLSKKPFYYLNRVIFSLSLGPIGYKNFLNFNVSGEKNLIILLNKIKFKFALDIGANKGCYSNLILKYTKMNVVAFEPNSDCIKFLNDIKKRYPDRFHFFQYALGEKNQKKNILINEKDNQLSHFDEEINKISFVKNKSKYFKKRVKVFKLDSAIKNNKKIFKRIDFIKIDVEGYEKEVLLGALKTIKNFNVKAIQIEMNRHQLVKNMNIFEFSKILKNYRVFKILPFKSGLEKVDPLSAEANIFHMSNFLFVRKGMKF